MKPETPEKKPHEVSTFAWSLVTPLRVHPRPPSTAAPHTHLNIVRPPGVYLLSQQSQMASIHAATISRAQDDCIRASSSPSRHQASQSFGPFTHIIIHIAVATQPSVLLVSFDKEKLVVKANVMKCSNIIENAQDELGETNEEISVHAAVVLECLSDHRNNNLPAPALREQHDTRKRTVNLSK